MAQPDTPGNPQMPGLWVLLALSVLYPLLHLFLYFRFKLYAFKKNTAISRCASMSPLFPIFSWTDSFYFSEHPTKIVCISHADRNTNFIPSHVGEAKQLLGSGGGLNSSWSISCSFPISLFPSLISNWWNGILWNMPRWSFSILIAVWNFTFPAPLGNCSLRHAVFFSKLSCSYCLTHLCSPQIDAIISYSADIVTEFS